MKRRRFLLASGVAILTGISQNQQPVLGLDFAVSTPNADPSNINSVLIHFESLKIMPQYLDDSNDIQITATVETEQKEEESTAKFLSVTNGETKDYSEYIGPIVVTPTSTDNSTLTGSITVRVEHPDITDEYVQTFNISSSGVPDNSTLSFENNLQEWNNSSNYSTVSSPVIDGNNSLDYDAGSGLLVLPHKFPRTTRLSIRQYNNDTSDNSNFYLIESTSATSTSNISGYGFSFPNAGGRMKQSIWTDGSTNSVYDSGYNTGDRTGNEWLEVILEINSDGTVFSSISNSSGNTLRQNSFADNKYNNLNLAIGSGGTLFLDDINIVE